MFIFILVVGLILYNKKLIVVFSGLLLWGLLAFRNLEMGLHDTLGIYWNLYRLLEYTSIPNVFINVHTRSLFGFALLTKLIQVFSTNYQLYVAVISIPMILAMMSLIYRKSENGMLSIVLYIALFYFFSYFLLRQVVALSILIAWAYPALEKKHLLKFISIVAIAMTFHTTAVVFLIAYPLARFVKFSRRWIIVIVGIAFAGMLIPQGVFQLISFLDVSHTLLQYTTLGIYTKADGDTNFGVVIQLLILLYCATGYKQLVSKDNNNNVLLHLVGLGMIFESWSTIVVEFYRVAMYFSIYGCILLPNRIKLQKKLTVRIVLNVVIILLTIVYTLTRTINNTGCNPYSFMWG